MKLNSASLRTPAWQDTDMRLPRFDISFMRSCTKEAPVWLHLGAGNIFRSFIAPLQQQLLNKGQSTEGIIVAETFDGEIVDTVYRPYDNLAVNVTLNADSVANFEVVASVAESLNTAAADDEKRLYEIFTARSLQMVSLTITEKGYALQGGNGEWLPAPAADMKNGPSKPRHIISMIAAGLYARYQAGSLPVAVVSMDNCSHNGDRLKASVTAVAEAWRKNRLVPAEFLTYLTDGIKVSFPWTMIDKITPRPSASVAAQLYEKGIEDMQPVTTDKGSYTAPFVNAERPQYLVIEDHFPADRPALEKAGVYFTDRETVDRCERMKVTTCLNPLHTAMSIFGCLLGYHFIYEEMLDPDITALIHRLGYTEGLPVVEDPGILSPKAFLDEVITERLPNPFLPDAPERIMTDTSQKVSIRFGETIKRYLETGRALNDLVAIPLAIAGWMRYLLGVDDDGNALQLSADPLKAQLQEKLAAIRWNAPESYTGQLRNVLCDSGIFGLDLTQTALLPRIEGYFRAMLGGKGTVRATLQQQLSGCGTAE